MKQSYVIMIIAFAAISCAILLSGCTRAPPLNNTTATLSIVPVSMSMPTLTPVPVPASAGSNSTSGHIYLNDSTISGAVVEAVSIDGTYRASNITNSTGAYYLLLPPGVQFNITATFQGMKRTVWPAFSNNVYDVNLTATSKSYITGTGRAVGGPLGFNASLYNLTGITIIADRGLGYPTITAHAGSDGRYVLEVEPGVLYHLRGTIVPSTWLYYRNTNNGGLGIDIMLRPGETALIDYAIVMPV